MLHDVLNLQVERKPILLEWNYPPGDLSDLITLFSPSICRREMPRSLICLGGFRWLSKILFLAVQISNFTMVGEANLRGYFDHRSKAAVVGPARSKA